MSLDSSDTSLVDRIVAEYLERKQAGQQPSIDDYCNQHPQQANEIRSLLKTLEFVDSDMVKGSPNGLGMCDTDPSNKTPKQIAHYRIVAEIGRGGMGVVYEAEHAELGRRVALKVLPAHISTNEHAVKRFVREGKAIAQMHHSNIVPLFEVGEENGRFFLAMQLIDGRSLDHVIHDIADSPIKPLNSRQTERLFPQLAVESSASALDSSNSSSSTTFRTRHYRSIARMGFQAADALSYAHQRGFIHRDVKPSNLLLDESGVVWLSDFGLAKSDGDDVTQTGDFVGTLRYMAPERFKGTCDEASDIYGLGLTLYELLALRPPFDITDRLGAIKSIVNDEPPRLRKIDPRIPRDIETIVMKAIEKEPSARYSSARAMGQDLLNFANDLPIRARRLSPLEQLFRWSQRNRKLAAAITIAFASLITLAVVSTANSIREKGLRVEAVEARNASEKKGNKLKEKTLELQRNLYYSEIQGAGDSLGKPAAGKKIAKVVEKWRVAGDKMGFLGWEWRFLNAITKTDDVQIEVGDEARSTAWSPDGEQFAIAHRNGVYILHGQTGELVKLIESNKEAVNGVAWHPSSSMMAAITLDGVVKFFDIESGAEVRQAVDTNDQNGILVQWDQSGKQLAISTSKNVYSLKPFEEDGKLQPSPVKFSSAAYLSWSPNGNKLAASRWFDNQLVVIDVANNRQVGPILKATTLDWTETNEIDAWFHSEQAGKIFCFDGASGFKTGVLVGHSDWARTVHQINHERSMLISGGNDWRCIVWDVAANKAVRSFSQHNDIVGSAQLSPDGRRAVSISRDSTWLWCVEQPTMIFLDNGDTLPSNHQFREKKVSCISWHPSGGMLAACGWDKSTRVWDIANRQCAYEFDGMAYSAAWTPDGSKLAIGFESTKVVDFENNAESSAQTVGGGSHNAWNHDGSVLISISRKSVNTIAFPGGKETAQFEIPYSSHPVWHPTEPDVFAFIGDRAVCISEKGQLRKLKTTHVCKAGLTWNPDGKEIAVATEHGTLTILDLDSNAEFVLAAHDNVINDVDWHPGGNRLATASTDGVVKIWDTCNWKETLTLNDLESGVTALEWSPDGTRLAAGDRNGQIVVWDASKGYQNND